MDQYASTMQGITSSPIYGAITLVLGVLALIGMFKIFKKAGKSPILAIIPIVNFFVMVDIVTGKPVKGLWMFVPVANIVFLVKLYIGLAKSFGYDTGIGILTFFIAPVGYMIMGLGSNDYKGPITK